MAQKPGTLVSLKCEGCPKSFAYRLTNSPFRKKFCQECATRRTYENKRRFDEGRKNKDIDEARRRQALSKLKDREFNPDSMINAAMKMVL